ncbi:DUF4249 domain-containing protein [Dyadobacter sp. NIV53]|uniref:DUF4249 domain-containing protein n=1 Tax=Dyadobacter sp. NIV53 TaxID=2861765 RepID=UPI001E45314D|nr:DUF4249 domain-containing protein [Dyadobacter sp. NIV53]
MVFGCIQPFSPPEINSPIQFLVVDGFLNIGSDTSKVELRYTQNTNDFSSYISETGARVSVASENGETYDFTEAGNGVYFLPPANMSGTVKYHLVVKTLNGKEYVSNDVAVITTPPIDSLGYRYDAGRDAVVISVNTHDPKNNTRFYRWKFEETFQYRAAYYSTLIVDVINKTLVFRKDDINLCWKTNKSTNIMLGSTIKLSADEIRDLPLNVVPVNTNKFYIKYSILVKQYGLSQEAFEYWTDLAKTTQGTGSLFDPQPSQVTGNIKNTTDAKELVFGYFSASTVAAKRIFMTPGLGSYPRCDPPDTLTIGEAISSPGAMLISYTGDRSEKVLSTSTGCADCRTQGGTTTKPPFWE